MKPEITNIEIDFTAWDERCPCFMVIETKIDKDTEYIDCAEDVVQLINEALETSRLTRETQIHISYKTNTSIPLTMNCSLSMQEILYFENKPKYGIDFLPPTKMTDEERKELVESIFSNADNSLQKEIYEVFEYLLNTEIQEYCEKGERQMETSNNTENKKILESIDVICLNCIEDTLEDNSCCEDCPVRKLADFIEY